MCPRSISNYKFPDRGYYVTVKGYKVEVFNLKMRRRRAEEGVSAVGCTEDGSPLVVLLNFPTSTDSILEQNGKARTIFNYRGSDERKISSMLKILFKPSNY